MNKILVVVIVAFAAGFLSNRIFSSSADTKPDKEFLAQCTDLASAKSNLFTISKNEYLEYSQIKDLKKKYEKADELLGKIMLLFLADLGFKAQKTEVPELIKPNNEDFVRPKITTIATASTIPTNSAPVQTVSRIGRKSSVIKHLPDERRLRDALDKAIIDDIKVESARGQMPNRRLLRMLEGRYSGIVRFIDGKRENLTVIWDLNPDYSKKGFSGTFNLSIQGPGMNSNSSGRGSIDNIVSLAEDQEGFLVNACGGNCYFQLYYNNPADQFFGNYYELSKDANPKFSRIGLVELRR